MIADSKKTGVRSRGNNIQGQAVRVIIEDSDDQTSDMQGPDLVDLPDDAPTGFDRALFFSLIKDALFRGRLKQVQVERIDAVLTELEYAALEDFGAWAYVLGTGHHESGEWLYYKELGGDDYFKRLYDIQGQRPAKARELGNIKPGDGARYCGRGPVGITGRANYRRQSKKLGIDLENSPELAEQAEIGARLLVEGMRDGDYRRRLDGRPYKLSDYFDGKRCDYIGARNIVNGGQDKAQLIASYAQAYYAALEFASSSQIPEIEPVDYYDTAPEVIEAELQVVSTPSESKSDQETKKPWFKINTAPEVAEAESQTVVVPDESKPDQETPKPWFKINPLDWLPGVKTHLIMLTTAGLAAAELFGVVIPEQVYVLLGALGLSTAYRGVTRNKNRSVITAGANEK